MHASDLLTGFWYVACHSDKLRKGKTIALTMLDIPLLLGRGNDGGVFALKDFCPHRGIPLRYGSFDGKEVECCYHGWRFNTQGACTHIPALTDEKIEETTRIRCASYPCRELHGLILVYMPNAGEAATQPPAFPVSEGMPLAWVDSVQLPCHIDHAVIGLMDPAHGPFVHRSWWWRTKRSIHAKQKQFAPVDAGFRMVSHKPSTNSRAYRVLGKNERKTEITFQLPGFRLEHIRNGAKNIVLLTALTPIDATATMLHQFIATDIDLIHLLLPLLRPFGKAFIRQDLEIVKKQQEGLHGSNTPLLLLGDADAQARWYFRLKKEWQEAQAEGRPFVNRLKARLLQWRS